MIAKSYMKNVCLSEYIVFIRVVLRFYRRTNISPWTFPHRAFPASVLDYIAHIPSVTVFLSARRYASAVLAIAWHLCLCLCLSVSHKSKFYQNGCTDRSGFWQIGIGHCSSYPILCYKEHRVSPK